MPVRSRHDTSGGRASSSGGRRRVPRTIERREVIADQRPARRERAGRTSSTPGRTQTVNFYRINGTHFFVDLPGYGYARAPKAIREAWGPMVEGFLERRRDAIALAIVLVDARHEPSDLDDTMLRWLVDRDIPRIVVGVKADKLSGNERRVSETRLKKTFATAEDGVAPFLVSAVTGLGLKDVWRQVDAALAAHDERPTG
jgi:GTP-binding protein